MKLFNGIQKSFLCLVSFLMLMTVLPTSIQIQAEDSYTINDLISDYPAFAFARNFGVVAYEFDKNEHAETSVYVQMMKYNNGTPFTNTDQVYRSDLNYQVTVYKTGDVESTTEFPIALFVKTDEGYQIVDNSKKTVSKSTSYTYTLSDYYGQSYNSQTSFYISLCSKK